MRYLFVILISFFALPAFSQQPSFFKIGEEELTGVHIYDLLQDKNLDYWIATNNGLYQFDHYNFKKVECDKMTSSSVFNLIENTKGEIYCHNLSGQIFKVIGEELSLFYQIPDSLMRHEISIEFDENDELTVLANSLFQVDANKKVKILFSEPEAIFSGGLVRNIKGELSFYSVNQSQIYSFSAGKIKKEEMLRNGVRASIVCIESNRFIFDQASGKLELRNNSKLETKLLGAEQGAMYYSDGEHIWQASRTGGAYVYNQDLSPFFKNKTVLDDFYISSLIRDKEGNIMLGTFGDGILVIPSLKTLDYTIPELNERAVQIELTPDGSLFIGCRSGKIFEFNKDGETKLISDQSQKTIEYIEYLAADSTVIFDGYQTKPTLSYNVINGETTHYDLLSLKDIKYIEARKYLIGNNFGCFWFYPEDTLTIPIPLFIGRSNCVGYEKDAGIIYSGSSSGLKIGTESSQAYFEINESPIICRNIVNIDNRLAIGTQKKGVLFFDNGELVNQWNEKSGLKTNNIFDILSFKDDFILSTDIGVFLVDKKGYTKFKFGTSIGITAVKPLDIGIHNETLYIVFRDQIKIIDLSGFTVDAYKPIIGLSEWFVNDSARNLDDITLAYDQNKVAFKLFSKSIKHKEETTHHYKLSDIDNNWQQKSYFDNQIEYKSLPPGEYTFAFYSEYQGKKSEVQEFNFKISTPFWNTIWFYASILGLFFLIVLVIYRVQLSRQNKISQIRREMIESKLTAIQSQMNPHFIFNSLNSIQDLVIRKDSDDAYSYISKFAFLVRRVLQHSEVDFVRLDEELEVLKVYLELEELRFDDDFIFTIDDENIEAIEIPPMIIQPFAENAIKHGLLHKEGEKRLDLKFKLNDRLLTCTIEDNGVGRAKSKEINNRKRKGHKSFSTSSIKNRFEILQNIHGGELGLFYEDKIENGVPTGTIVTLQIPINRSY